MVSDSLVGGGGTGSCHIRDGDRHSLDKKDVFLEIQRCKLVSPQSVWQKAASLLNISPDGHLRMDRLNFRLSSLML